MSSGGESKPSRRLSEIPGISSIFKFRNQIIDDNLSEPEFGESCGGMGNGPNSQENSQSGIGPSASSVPLLSDIQHQHHHHHIGIISMDSTVGQNLAAHQSSQRDREIQQHQQNMNKFEKTFDNIRRALFSKTARKLLCGFFLSLLVSICWNICIHSIKHLYKINHIYIPEFHSQPSTTSETSGSGSNNNNNNATLFKNAFDPSQVYQYYNNHDDQFAKINSPSAEENNNLNGKNSTLHLMPNSPQAKPVFDAPFFSCWLLTISTILYYPIHQMTVRFCSCMGRNGPKSMSRSISDAVQGFKDRGMTLFQFMKIISGLSFLWLITNYMMMASLRILNATTLISLIATTTSFSYILSWVVLHNQFVGLRIFAVILSNMGIMLFAYMDGIDRGSPTVWAVILGALAAGISAVFKVTLKKSFGLGATISQQVALIFSCIGFFAMIIYWPLFTVLYFTGVEEIAWSFVPWEFIIAAILASLTINLLESFGVTCTFESFITIGLLLAIPGSAVLDWHLYRIEYEGMTLAGIITICIGFCIVILPEDLPNYITKLIRYLAQLKHSRWGRPQQQVLEPIDTRTGHIRSHLRSPSGRVR